MKTLITMLIVLTIFVVWSDDLTIYQSGEENFALVHASQQVKLEKGENEIQLQGLTKFPQYNSFLLDPDNSVELLFLDQNKNVNAAYDLYKTAEGHEVTIFSTDGEPVTGILRAKQGFVVIVSELNSNNLHLIKEQNISRIILHDLADSETANESTLKLNLHSDKTQKTELRYSYLSNRIGWKSLYQAIWDEKKEELDFTCQVELSNYSGKDFENSSIKLMAGDIKSLDSYPQAGRVRRIDNSVAISASPSYSEISSFHLYKLKEPINLPDKSVRQFQLYPSGKIKADQYFYYLSGASNSQLQKTIIFENTKENGFGHPLPEGIIKVYTPDSTDGQLQFLGDSSIDNTSIGRKVIITLGSAFDLSAETKILKTQYDEKKKNTISQECMITINNDGSKDADIIIHHTTSYLLTNIIDENFEYTRIDERKIEIQINVPANSNKVLTWTQKK